MKPLLTFLILPFLAHSQLKIGMTAGISSKNCAVGELYSSVPLSKKVLLYPLAIKIHSRMQDPCTPVIYEARAGYKIKPFEFYSGIGYHFAGMDNRKEFEQYQGLKPAAGIIWHVWKRVIVSGAVSGNVYTLQFGLN